MATTGYRFWSTPLAAPRIAAVWLLHGAMKVFVRLPFDRQIRFGKWLGRGAHRLMGKRRRIALRNVEICLPELAPDERESLVRRHFESLGASLPETAMGWFGPVEEIRRRVEFRGAEHLDAALAQGRGVILFSAHFTPLEVCFPALRPLAPRITGMYKPQRNPAMNRIMLRGRGRNVDEQFSKDNVRAMLRNLARNSVVWYASDQSYGHKGSVLIPFFGEPAMTNTAICRIAARSGAIVLPYFYRRKRDDSGYIVDIYPPLEGFPSGDSTADVTRLTRLLEDYIRQSPEQYWWIHQRFKGRPAPYPDVYRTAERAA